MGRDRRHPSGPGRLAHWLPTLLVLLLLGAAVGAHRYDVGERYLGWRAPEAQTGPATVAPPAGWVAPDWQAPAPVATAVPVPGALPLDPAAVRAALAPGLAEKALGRRVVAAVGDLAGAGTDYAFGAGAFMPASTTKVLTVAAALEVLGPQTRFSTRAVQGSTPREVVLVGGGDPYLAGTPLTAQEALETYPTRADVVTLARRTAAALPGRGRVAVRYDDSLFTGPADNPRWRADYVPDDIVSPITALWVDSGRSPTGSGRVEDPSYAAAATFAAALERAGVRVAGAPRPGRAPVPATELAAVESAPLADIAEHVLEVSDNEGAEVLAHHVGLAVHGDGSFAGGARGVLDTLHAMGVRTGGDVLHDGSGLSRFNRVSATTLLAVLRRAAAPEAADLRPLLTGLPVAGFTGSLTYRFDRGAPRGRGVVRAKTGTLSGVHALSGLVTDRAGTPLVFVLAADRVRQERSAEAQQVLDELAAALAACRCSR